jgi:hypothetical protein
MDAISDMIEKYEFYGIRVLDGHLIPAHWELTFNFQAINDGTEKSVQESIISYHKIKFWLESVLSDVIISNHNDELGENLYYSSSNSAIVCPSTPTDSQLVQLIHAKLNSIGFSASIIDDVSLNASDSTATYVYSSAGEYTINKDYIKDRYHKEPWWLRNSYDAYDVTCHDVEQDEELQNYIKSEDPLSALEKQLRNELKGADQSAKIIKMPTNKWTPKIV